MGKKRLIVFLIFLISIYAVHARYQVSIPFSVDAGGRPVASATVGINISEGSNCVSPFYFNKTTAQYGRGEINVTSPRFIAGRVYTMCFNSTVGSNTLRGRTSFSPGVGDINVSRWVNGSSSRFNSYQLNNGSTFDVIYGRQDGNVTLVGITNIIYNGTGIKLIQVYNSTLIKQITVYNNTLLKLTQGFNGTLLKLVNAYNSTLIKQVTAFNGTLTRLTTVYNGTLAKDKNLVKNNTAQGKVYLNSTLVIPRRINITSGNPVIAYISSDSRLNQTTLCDAQGFCNFTWQKPNTPTNFWIALSSVELQLGTNFKSMQFANNLVPKVDNVFDLGSIVSSTPLYWRNVSSYKFQLKNGSNFDVIYGARANQTLARGLVKNNTALGKTYLNNTNGIFFSSLFKGLYGVVDNNLTIGNSGVYGINITGQYINISNSGRIVLAGKYITAWKQVNSTIRNNSNIGKIFFNNSVFFNGTIQVRTYTLRNGSTFDVIYGRQDGNVTPIGITNIIYNGTGVKLVQVYNSTLLKQLTGFNGTLIKQITVYNGTLAKDKNLVKNNTVQGKIYLNTSSSGLFISGNVTARRYYLTNGSIFDVIYGRDTTGTGIANNTAQGKAYINSSLYPGSIRFGNWNISYTRNKLAAGYGDGESGEINIFANNSGFIQRSNDSEPYSKSGCFRINGANYLGEGSGAGWTIPGTVHIGSECGQGWTQAYIDINDVNQNTSSPARLMQFWWNNKGPANGIGLSMRLDSKSSATILQDLNYGYTGPGTSNPINLMTMRIPSFTPNNSVKVDTVRYIELVAPASAAAGSMGKLVGISSLLTSSPNRLNTFVLSEIRRNVLVVQATIVGLGVGNQPRNPAQQAGKFNRSYAVMSEGSPIQLSAGTAYIYNGPQFLTDNWDDATIGNVSAFYEYTKDILVTQFAGRTDGTFNLTKMSKRQYNLSFADYLYVNDTLKISGNATHPDLKIDKTNFTIKSFNSTAYLNCGYFKSVNDGTIKLICDGVTV